MAFYSLAVLRCALLLLFKIMAITNYVVTNSSLPLFLSHFVSFFLKPNAYYFMPKPNKLNH